MRGNQTALSQYFPHVLQSCISKPYQIRTETQRDTKRHREKEKERERGTQFYSMYTLL